MEEREAKREGREKKVNRKRRLERASYLLSLVSSHNNMYLWHGCLKDEVCYGEGGRVGGSKCDGCHHWVGRTALKIKHHLQTVLLKCCYTGNTCVCVCVCVCTCVQVGVTARWSCCYLIQKMQSTSIFLQPYVLTCFRLCCPTPLSQQVQQSCSEVTSAASLTRWL